jgi:NAD(P)-dependent dehydrogenase (short-subunit alcohol dehydrogenase family)
LFDGKVAIVTGAGRDRREEALLLADEGAQVVVNDLGGGADGSGADRGPAQQVVEEILAAGGSAAANTDDISSWAGAVALMGLAVERCVATHPGLHRTSNQRSSGPRSGTMPAACREVEP